MSVCFFGKRFFVGFFFARLYYLAFRTGTADDALNNRDLIYMFVTGRHIGRCTKKLKNYCGGRRTICHIMLTLTTKKRSRRSWRQMRAQRASVALTRRWLCAEGAKFEFVVFLLKEKDTYGNEVSRMARPFPVEYLLLDVPASTPVTPNYTFNMDPAKQPFPVENRLVDGHIQDFNALNQYLSQFATGEFFTAINDFHLLLYIATMDMLPMKEYMGPLLEALKAKDENGAEEWSRSEHWATIEQLIAASSPPPSRYVFFSSSSLLVNWPKIDVCFRPGSVASGSVGAVAGAPGNWTCPHCTFLNTSEVSNCEMCSLPRSTSH